MAAVLVSLIVIVPLALLGWDLARNKSADVPTGTGFNPQVANEPVKGSRVHGS